MTSPNEQNPSDPPSIMKGKRQLGPEDEFCFGCHAGLECFKRCCHDVNILLTPIDVLQLARHIGITTTEFLDKHTLVPIHKDLNLPVVALKMSDEEDKRCSFLGEDGCTVYEHRPWSCRMYPLGMAFPPAKAGVELEPVFFLFNDDHCDGDTQETKWTVEKWRSNQGVPELEALEEGFKDVVSHPWFIGGQRQLDPKRMQMFHTACYDLDSFRRFIFDSTFLERFELEKELVEEMRKDDVALLRFAFRWLRYALFAEPTMTPRSSGG